MIMNDMTDANWEILMTAENEAMAELARQRLEAAKIPCVLVPGDASAYMGAGSSFDLKVPADKVEQAREVLA